MVNLPAFDIAQAVGFLCFFLGILCFYQKDDRKLKLTMVALNLSQAIHFAMLGAMTACVSAIIALLRTSVSIKTQSRFVAYAFIALTLVWGIYLADKLVDMLPIVGACIGTYALFCLKGIAMRCAFIVGACCWLANNIIVGSIGTSLLETVLIIVNLSTIIRLYRLRRAQ